MFDHTAAMLAFVKLAGVSQNRGQLGTRDRFLILAAESAARGGAYEVAARCRELILLHNPSHLLGHTSDVPAALGDSDFTAFLKQLHRFCSYERAEHLLSGLEIAPGLPTHANTISPRDYALLLLARAADPPSSASSTKPPG